jgi:hypothetical protein
MIWKVLFSFLLVFLTITHCGSQEMEEKVAEVSPIPRLALQVINGTVGGKDEQKNEEENFPRATEAGTDPSPVVPLKAIARKQESLDDAHASMEAAENIVTEKLNTVSSTDPPVFDFRSKKKEKDEERQEEEGEGEEERQEEPEIYTEPPVQVEKEEPLRRDDGEMGRKEKEGHLRGALKDRNPLRLVPVIKDKNRNEELLDASLRGDTKAVIELIRSENVDVNTQNDLFWTPLIFAASR